MKKWKINKPDPEKVKEFSAKCDLSPLVLDVMTSRGYDSFDKLVEFFNSPELTDPFEIKDMDKAAEAINKAIDAYDLICIYGDYDCDGVTSTSILYNYLESMGANVMYYIPEREEGYGMNMQAIEKLSEEHVKLIVTVDNGISAIEEAEKIAELGMELVVTDHHQPGETLPNALAVVNPHREDDESACTDLAGVGVAFKLCAALDGGSFDAVLEQYADICAIGTVADVVPLIGENRTIVKKGLEYIPNTEVLGIDKILEKTKLDRNNITSTNIAFRIAPLINASGRFGSPLTAVKLITAEYEEDAENYAETIVGLNAKRKETEAEITKEILLSINAKPDILNHRVIILSGKGWHHGVIGIVASRILELYSKPAILISIEENGMARGSARSVRGFNIFTCLQNCEEVLTKYGGHECAGGFSLNEENIDRFKELVYEFSDENGIIPLHTITADKLLQPKDLSLESVKGLSVLEPCGAENPQPVFAILGARVDKITPLSQGKHTKIDFSYGSVKEQALMFGFNPQKLCFGVGDKLDMLVNLDINVFNGKESVSVRVLDHRLSGVKQEPYFAARECYEKLMRGDKLPQAFIRKIIPAREELVSVYKYISRVKQTTVDNIFMRITDPNMNYCKLKICLDIFADKELIEFKPATMKINILPVTKKVDLEDSDTLVKLHSMLERAEV